jgi:hypothetical protein
MRPQRAAVHGVQVGLDLFKLPPAGGGTIGHGQNLGLRATGRR